MPRASAARGKCRSLSTNATKRRRWAIFTRCLSSRPSAETYRIARRAGIRSLHSGKGPGTGNPTPTSTALEFSLTCPFLEHDYGDGHEHDDFRAPHGASRRRVSGDGRRRDRGRAPRSAAAPAERRERTVRPAHPSRRTPVSRSVHRLIRTPRASHPRRTFFVPREHTMTIETTGSTALADVQRELERELDERLAVLQDLAPYAVPSVDPVAFRTAASHRVAVEQI